MKNKPDSQESCDSEQTDALENEGAEAAPETAETENFRADKRRRRRPSRKPRDLPLEEGAASIPHWDPSQFDVAPEEGKTRFHDLALPLSILHGVFDMGFKYCTAIQSEILPKALTGQDVIGQAQTGTGKSAAFLIAIFSQFLNKPILERRSKGTPRALILAPTRELALQIEKDALAIGKYTGLRTVAVFGGMSYDQQKKSLQHQLVDVIVATPGRLLDFKNQNILRLNEVECLVIDEADRMLDMGFIPDIRKIVQSTPQKSERQTMFFSATLNDDVNRLAAQWTKDSFGVEIEPDQIASDTISQIVYLVTTDEKYSLLYNLITRQELKRVIVFTNRRDQARDLTASLTGHQISCALISGELDQKKRIRALENFREGKIRVLVATDVAARGIHIDNISHVINYNFPHDPEHYVHRIGRTGRAGATGISVSFACEEDSFYIPAVEKVLGHELKCEYPEEQLLETPPPLDPPDEDRSSRRSRPPVRRSGSKTAFNKQEEGGRRGRPHRGGKPSSGSKARSGAPRRRPRNPEATTGS